MVSFSFSEKLDVRTRSVRWMRGAQVYMYPSKISNTAICTVRTVELNNKHTSGGCTTKALWPAGCCWAPLVSVKSWMSYTKCTIEEGGSSIHVPFKISYTAICTVRTAEFNNKHTSGGCTTKPFGLQAAVGPFSVSEKLDVVHQVYDRRGGLKYTCTLQN